MVGEYKFYKNPRGGIQKAQVLKVDGEYAFLYGVPMRETCIKCKDLHESYEKAKESDTAEFLD